MRDREKRISKLTGKIVLIGGTSHCGKTTLAKKMSESLKVANISTDSLAKHPGRPWKDTPEEIPENVKNYYSRLSSDEMIASVLEHYENLWPTIKSKIGQAKNENLGIIIEGSAILPKLVGPNSENKIIAVWLTSKPENLISRIYESSKYWTRSSYEKKLIDRFIERTIAFDNLLAIDLKKLGTNPISVDKKENQKDLEKKFLEMV